MKTKVKRLSKRTLAVFLGVMMLVTSIGIGSLITTDAWTTSNSYITGAWDSWYKHYITSSDGYADFDVTTAGNYDYLVYAENNKYGYIANWNERHYDDTKAYNYEYMACGGPESSSNTNAYFPKGQYVMKLVSHSNDWKTFNYWLYRKKANIDFGWDNESWSNEQMEYTSDGVYKLEIEGNGKQYRFRPNFIDGGTTHNYRPAGTGSVHAIDLTGFTDYDGKYTCKTSDSDGNAQNYFYFDTLVGAKYTIWLKNGGVWLTYTENAPEIFGSLNNSSWQSYSSHHDVMDETGTRGVYSFTSNTSAATHYYRFKVGDNYYKFGSSDGDVSTDSSSPTSSVSNGTSDASSGAFRFSNSSGAEYTIYVDITQNPPTTWVEFGSTFYVASGDSSLSGNSWVVADSNGKMSLSSGTTYTKTFSKVSAGTYQFRITNGTNYITDSNLSSYTGNVEPTLNGDNVKFTLGATDTSYNVTITYDSDTGAVTVNAKELSEEEEASGDSTYDPIFNKENNEQDNSSWNLLTGTTSTVYNLQKISADSVYTGNNYYFKIPVSALNGTNNEYIAVAQGNNYYDIKKQGGNPSVTVASRASAYLSAGGQNYNGNGSYSNVNYGFSWVKFSNSTAAASFSYIVLIYNNSTHSYTYDVYESGSSSSSKFATLDIIAKDGTLRSDNGGFADTATTSIVTASNGDTAYTNGATDGVYDTNGYLFTMGGTTTIATGREYKSATLKIKKDEDVKYTLHIKTAISSTDNYNTRYFVKGWCVNGKTYGYRDSDTVTANGNYYCDIDVTYADFAATSGELYENGKIEITPIYYTVEQSKCISFRVENFNEEVQNADWGKTLYAYPFYGDLSNVKNSYGAYPGQPLVYYNGKYSIQVPIESIAIKTSDNGDDGINIRGITLNNGWEDSVHRTACGWADNDRTKHKQTYDYDDFYKIYNEKNANDIIFRFKYRDTEKSYNKDNYFNANSYTGKPTLAADVTASAETANDKGWELLRDRAGRVIDIFGNPIKNTSTNEYITTTTATAADPSDLRTQSGVEPVRVVSNGYFDNCSGEYSTEWMVYSRGTSNSGDYSLIKYDNTKFSIVPSALLMNSADNMDNYKTYRNKPTNYYKEIYNTLNSTSTAKGKPAFIAYEKDMVRSDNAVRCDGRWYYTTSNDYVKSRIKIQYKTAAGNWVDDTYADSTNDSDITGVTTGGKAYFTNEAYENKRVSDSEIYSSDSSDNNKFTAKSGTNYQFAGWYFEYDEDTDNPTYKQITTDASGEAARTSSDLLVARYVPVKSGEVYISHEVGTDDANFPGTGTTEAKVEVLNGSNSVVKTYDYSTENIKVGSTYIKETNTGYKLKITLRTTPGTDNTFKKFAAETTTATYSKDSTSTAYNFATTYESSSAYTGDAIYVSVSDIINNDISTLQYYSYLIKKTHKYQITYQFDSTRLQKENMSFQKNGTFSETAYANNVTINGNTRTVSTAFIKSVAPHESNFKEILSIDDTCTINQSFTSDSTTVTHKITVKFKSNENKDVTGVFHLPYKYTKGSGSGDNGAYAAQDGYDNYNNVSEYYVAGNESGYGDSGTPIPTVSKGIMLDGSTESFNIYTTYGGHFTTNDTKVYATLDAIKNDKNNIISAPETIVKSVTKEVTKKTIYMDGNTKLTWAALGNSASADYIAEMKRIAGIENLDYENLTANEKTALKNKYTYTLNGTAYRCYRVETETKYVPTDETLTFAYWKIENADREEIARCYYKDFTYLAFENYHITPTYLDNEQLAEFNKNKPSTSISYMEESRNQWNNNGGSGAQNLFDSSDSKAGDYIFVDFATSFDYQDLILKDYSGVQEMGVIVQKAGSRVDGVTSSSGYKQLYKSGETENTTAVLEDIVKNATSSGKYTNSTTNKKYQKIIIDKSNLNNKNRLDYVLTVCNSYDWNGDFETGSAQHKDTTYSGNAFRVYSYIKVDDKIAVSSNPAYFCTYATANR